MSVSNLGNPDSNFPGNFPSSWERKQLVRGVELPTCWIRLNVRWSLDGRFPPVVECVDTE